LKWFLEGDLNIKFFHTVTSNNKRKNYIFFSLDIDGVKVYDQKILQTYVIYFYRSLIGTTSERTISLSLDF
jgi:hypothetical protein